MKHELKDGTLKADVGKDGKTKGIIGYCTCGWNTGSRFSPAAASVAFREHQEEKENELMSNTTEEAIALCIEKVRARESLRPMSSAPKNKYILVFCDSGYIGTPLRCHVAKHDEKFRPNQPWVDYSGDSITEYGSGPLGWLPLPWEERALETPEVIAKWRAIIHAAWHMLDEQEESEQDPDLLKAIMDYSSDGDIHEMLSRDAAALAAAQTDKPVTGDVTLAPLEAVIDSLLHHLQADGALDRTALATTLRRCRDELSAHAAERDREMRIQQHRRTPSAEVFGRLAKARRILGETLDKDFGFWSSPANEKYRSVVYEAYQLLWGAKE